MKHSPISFDTRWYFPNSIIPSGFISWHHKNTFLFSSLIYLFIYSHQSGFVDPRVIKCAIVTAIIV